MRTHRHGVSISWLRAGLVLALSLAAALGSGGRAMAQCADPCQCVDHNVCPCDCGGGGGGQPCGGNCGGFNCPGSSCTGVNCLVNCACGVTGCACGQTACAQGTLCAAGCGSSGCNGYGCACPTSCFMPYCGVMTQACPCGGSNCSTCDYICDGATTTQCGATKTNGVWNDAGKKECKTDGCGAGTDCTCGYYDCKQYALPTPQTGPEYPCDCWNCVYADCDCPNPGDCSYGGCQ